jgi:hypothetical protein
MAPIPALRSSVIRSPSTQRFNIEYEGWWMTSGVPSRFAIAAASAVFAAE